MGLTAFPAVDKLEKRGLKKLGGDGVGGDLRNVRSLILKFQSVSHPELDYIIDYSTHQLYG